MKKLLSLLLVLLVSTSTFAQSEKGTIYIVPKAGINLASINGTDLPDDIRFMIGFVGGIDGGYQVSEKLALTGGLMFSMQGYKIHEFGTSEKYKLNYINIPILCNYYIGEGLAIKAGIEPGFNLSAKHSDLDIKNVKSVVFAVPIGASYEYQNFILDARYNIGFTKIGKDGKAYNGVFQFTLGYKFEL